MSRTSLLTAYTAEILRRLRAGETSTQVARWLESQGVPAKPATVRKFASRRRQHGPPKHGPPPIAPEAVRAQVIPLATSTVSSRSTAQTLGTICELALAKVRSGQATVADAKVLEAALRATLAGELVEGAG